MSSLPSEHSSLLIRPPLAFRLSLLLLLVNVEGRLQDGSLFYDYAVEELDFTLGQGETQRQPMKATACT